MQCDRCADDAVLHMAYSGAHLCESHLRYSIEKRVRRRIREDSLLDPDTTPADPETWVIGLSGGKDSAVLTDIVHRTFLDDPRVELVAVTIHEGIAGYRDESLDACIELADRLDITHHINTYEDEFGVRMDDIVEHDEATMAACAYCGVFRRDILERAAIEHSADKLLTGHNLDDEAQTAMMNFLSGDVTQMAKHFEASLGAFDERRAQEAFIPRAKPLRDIPEREVALYAHLADLPVHFNECPHSSEAFRGTIQELLYALEDDHPGTRHSIMAGYEQLASMAATKSTHEPREDLHHCGECGSLTTGEQCRKCELLERFSAPA